MFNLKTSVSELTSLNNGMAKAQFEQIAASRDVTGNNFPNSSIHYRWETSGQKWWIPSQSYIRVRASLTKNNGTPLTLSDNIAPSMNLCPNLFQSAEFRINDKTVSRVSDFLPQVDSLENRIYKSKSWLDGVAKSTNYWDPSFQSRQADVCADGVRVEDTTNVVTPQGLAFSRADLGLDDAGGAGNNRNAAAYVDATGIITFTRNGGAALPGNVRVLFPPGSTFQYTAIDGAVALDPRLKKPAVVLAGGSATTILVAPGSFGGDVAADGRTDFVRTSTPGSASVNIARRVSNFELLWQPPLSVFKVDTALPVGRYELVLNPQTSETFQKAVIESIGADKNAGADFKFSIVDMYLVTRTVEGPRCDSVTYLLDLNSTRCQTELLTSADFHQKTFDCSSSTYALACAYQDQRLSNTLYSASKFKAYDAGGASSELNLTRFFLNYAGQNYPQLDAAPEFKAGTDYTVERYISTQLQTGAYEDTGSAESLKNWQDRGAYYYFQVPRDGTDKSTRVSVSHQFSGGTPAIANTRVLIFDMYKQVARISVQDGRVVSCDLENA